MDRLVCEPLMHSAGVLCKANAGYRPKRAIKQTDKLSQTPGTSALGSLQAGGHWVQWLFTRRDCDDSYENNRIDDFRWVGLSA